MPLEQIFDVLEMNNFTFVRVLKIFFLNMAQNEKQGALQSIITGFFRVSLFIDMGFP